MAQIFQQTDRRNYSMQAALGGPVGLTPQQQRKAGKMADQVQGQVEEQYQQAGHKAAGQMQQGAQQLTEEVSMIT